MDFDNQYIWKDLKDLEIKYKKIITHYFNDKNGKYYINNNILYINYENWGIEKFYIDKNSLPDKLYKIIYKNFKNIYGIGITIQIGNWNTFLKMESYLNNFKNINTNIYFTIVKEFCTDSIISYLINKYDQIVIIECENKGMDIGLFLISLHYILTENINHECLFKIHTKTDDNFRNECLNNLLLSHQKILRNVKELSKKNIGMISGNNIFNYNDNKNHFNNNLYYLELLSKYLCFEDLNYDNLVFSGGTFFIVKPAILFKIFNIKNIEFIYDMLNNNSTLDYNWYAYFYNLNINDKRIILKHFNIDRNRYLNNLNYQIRTGNTGIRDYMIEHALERFFGYIVKKYNMEIINTI
jgi:hypothetical protein